MIDLDLSQAGLRRVERLNLGFSASAVAASMALAGPHFAGSLAFGAALEALNFRGLHSTAERFFGAGGSWLGGMGLRLGLLTGALALALAAGAQPVGLLLGLSMICPAVVVDAWRNRPPVVEQPDWPVPPPDDPSWHDFNILRMGPAEARADDDDFPAEGHSDEPSGRDA